VHLVSLSKPSLEVVEADQRATKMEERLVNVLAPLIADREPAVLRKPGQCALHDPPVSSQLLAALYALSCYTALYPTFPQSPFALLVVVVVSFVGMQSFSGRSLGLPLPGRLMGSTASMSSSKSIESWVLAAVRIAASGIPSGIPFRSETRWRFVPFFPLSVGFAAVFAPPFCFWRVCSLNPQRHAPSR
jgi:hypothetical protein